VTPLAGRGGRRLILAVDLRSYSAHTYAGQHDAQTRLQRVVGYALRRARIARVRVQRQKQGDGQLVVFPPAIDELSVVPSLILGLQDGLYHLNLAPGAFGRMRMRAALGQGPVLRSANGYVGDSVVHVSRLVDAETLRKALEETRDSDLALAVTPELYREILCRDAPGLPAARFERRELAVPGKGFAAEAWLHVPRSSPAVDVRGAAVRWGDSPTLAAMRSHVVPAVAAVHLAEAARYILAPAPQLVEWEIGKLQAHEGHAQDHAHGHAHGHAQGHAQGHAHDASEHFDEGIGHASGDHADHVDHVDHHDAHHHDTYGDHHDTHQHDAYGDHHDVHHHDSHHHDSHHDHADDHSTLGDHHADAHHTHHGGFFDAVRHLFDHSDPMHDLGDHGAAGPTDSGH
jgi:hypothetical protein